MNRYTLALGSNLGDTFKNLRLALKELGQLGKILQVAPTFENPPMLPPNAPSEWYRFFINSALVIETPLSALELLNKTQLIERTLGRAESRQKWSPRTLDIDIIFSHDRNPINSSDLTLPHPAWHERNFVLAPLLHLTKSSVAHSDVLHQARALKNMPPSFMATINATPDSFSNSQNAINHDLWIEQLQNALNSNVAFIDLGGESTRPGATALTWHEEWARLEPVLAAWKDLRHQHPFTRLSLDTYHPETAQKALDYNVDILNDVTHLKNPTMRELAPHFESVILMHSLTVPADKNITWPEGTDEITALKEWFDQTLTDLKLSPEHVIFDPGLGFGKTALQSLHILQRLSELKDIPARRLIGHSRKSFMNLWTQIPAVDRDTETVATTLALGSHNIEIWRVHDVVTHQRALRAAAAVGAP